jgi:catalase
MKMMDMDLFIPKMRGKFRDIFDILRYFAEVEQSAFNPANIVPGIGFSPDKMLQGPYTPAKNQRDKKA